MHCGFARVAMRDIIKNHADTRGNHQLTTDIIKDYNEEFQEYPQMKLEGNEQYVLKKCKELNASFSKKWNPQENLHIYIHTFSKEKWSKLSLSQKLRHARTECTACPIYFPDMTRAFPGKKRALSERNMVEVTVKHPSISLPPTKLAKKLGGDIVSQLDHTCVELTGGSLADVLQKTPAAGLVKRKPPAEIKKENRDRLRGVKQAIESELHKIYCFKTVFLFESTTKLD